MEVVGSATGHRGSSAAQELFVCDANSIWLSFTPKPRRLGQAYQAREHASMKRSLRMKLDAIGDGALIAAHYRRDTVAAAGLWRRVTRVPYVAAQMHRDDSVHSMHSMQGLLRKLWRESRIPCRTTRLFSSKRLEPAVVVETDDWLPSPAE